MEWLPDLSFGEWTGLFEAVGTTGALLATIWIATGERRRRKRSHANQVAAWVAEEEIEPVRLSLMHLDHTLLDLWQEQQVGKADPYGFVVWVKNDSPMPVRRAMVHLKSATGRSAGVKRLAPLLAPGDSLQVPLGEHEQPTTSELNSEPPPMRVDWLRFDVDGKQWVRLSDGSLKRRGWFRRARRTLWEQVMTAPRRWSWRRRRRRVGLPPGDGWEPMGQGFFGRQRTVPPEEEWPDQTS